MQVAINSYDIEDAIEKSNKSYNSNKHYVLKKALRNLIMEQEKISAREFEAKQKADVIKFMRSKQGLQVINEPPLFKEFVEYMKGE